MPFQQGLLATPVPAHARHLFFTLQSPEALPAALDALLPQVDGKQLLLGVGAPLAKALGREIPGLRPFPLLDAAVENPSTQHALWLWLRGDERGDLLLRTQALEQALAPALSLADSVDGFLHRGGHDLTGYEDGTENPTDEEAVQAAIAADGSSFAAFQLWKHDLQYFKSLPQADQDNIIGRRLSDNEELDDAPASAHVKRTAQESFEPEAFMVRRSVSWADQRGAGLAFVALGKSFEAFEVQLRRMSGLEDGIIDGLYRFSRPLTGGYYWCPPMSETGVDLSPLLRA
ncbi:MULTISPECIES: Dyp-type peroxidase [Pseudomonas]|jgi:putative iron-dependent peroxidase|uniref:Dyp-type peroxidase family protein n=2 Tax=Pseudomonas putida group TaxID=136845 RepID=Q88HV5_PSEPK|nr:MULTISPECIES: Dyp-type peroxidase [Pseudomonas]7QYQ_A Chain A, Dyp-type peroxidase family protein [Pseudomonas putida]7QYQ_B Chain B, Dyp-type peroxidase family protein [Pseudomonas putida]7QYQ_C Chain C, Dyp-type peroxidase family protein [Pseudomonas putida]7QYQ_D Chain D, Dyp-type peroxidase family protein [Pseudomonas putida]AAN68855.1 Dyp-type peroxidase family protein [Pseudomonas putida KT2440]KMU94439.1 peroxidase [Pseudomonas putida]KMY34204.1 peroxidase [Pseudomonas putida]MBP2